MKSPLSRIQSLVEALSSFLLQETRRCRESLATSQQALSTLQSETRDPRLPRLALHLKNLQEQFNHLETMPQQDFLVAIHTEIKALEGTDVDRRIATVLTAVLQCQPLSLNKFGDFLLDSLTKMTGARRSFLLLYSPESTAAEVISARQFASTNLSLDEYGLSRTLLREVLRKGESLLFQDVSKDATYSTEMSVRNFELKSVLVVPLKQRARTMGAIYLDNNTLAGSFSEGDVALVEAVARFASFYLHHSGLLPRILQRENRVFLEGEKVVGEIIGRDPKLVELLGTIRKIARTPATSGTPTAGGTSTAVRTPATVLIEGETGTGKELVARALHSESPRASQPFVAINCAAIPRDLLESELFGHDEGAFTGATRRFVGRIEQANRGTLFLDEVSELAYPLQAKLLRFLQSNEFQRLGGKETHHVDVRVVAATSKDLKEQITAGKFHAALYYRLNVIPLRLPPLRERKEDIPLLVDHFLHKFSTVYGRNFRIEREALNVLETHSFPGNVRELENLIHRMAFLSQDDMLRLVDLPLEVLQVSSQRISLGNDGFFRMLACPPKDLEELRLREEEIRQLFAEQRRQLAERALQRAGNVTAAASQVGVHRATLHKMLGKRKSDEDPQR
jgi:Nif-specific regulatory protein